MSTAREEVIFRGISASPGVVHGQILKLDSRNRAVLKLLIDANSLQDEVSRCERAIQASKKQLKALKARLEKKIGPEHSYILDVHLLMLEDSNLVSEIVDTIRSRRANAEWAVRQVTDRLHQAYASLEDEYFRDRSNDIESVVERILLNLSGDKPFSWAQLPENLIVASKDFNPSTFAIMDLRKVRGLALESGGRTSHTAIICRSLRLPAVMGLTNLLARASSGDAVILNGDEGQLILNPAPERLESVRDRLTPTDSAAEISSSPVETATRTRDGTRIFLRANTDLPDEARTAKVCGAEGIGLFRTEFLFFTHPQGFPGKERQYEIYRRLAEEMQPHPVAIRTLDMAGDKPGFSPSVNTNMGLRGIRLSLMDRSAFSSQLEAIVLASRHGNPEIVLPMVTTVEEIQETKLLIEDIRKAVFESSGEPVKSIPLGVMVEVPAAVFALESMAGIVDFFSVGTNDLIQYMLAVDRGNSQVSHLFQPLHPSILQCLRRIAKVGEEFRKPVRICGEMSSNPFFVVLLIGMGFTELSMNSFAIPIIRRVIHEVDLECARKISSHALTLTSSRDIGEYLIGAVSDMVKTDLSPFVKEVRTAGIRANSIPVP